MSMFSDGGGKLKGTHTDWDWHGWQLFFSAYPQADRSCHQWTSGSSSQTFEKGQEGEMDPIFIEYLMIGIHRACLKCCIYLCSFECRSIRRIPRGILPFTRLQYMVITRWLRCLSRRGLLPVSPTLKASPLSSLLWWMETRYAGWFQERIEELAEDKLSILLVKILVCTRVRSCHMNGGHHGRT